MTGQYELKKDDFIRTENIKDQDELNALHFAARRMGLNPAPVCADDLGKARVLKFVRVDIDRDLVFESDTGGAKNEFVLEDIMGWLEPSERPERFQNTSNQGSGVTPALESAILAAVQEKSYETARRLIEFYQKEFD